MKRSKYMLMLSALLSIFIYLYSFPPNVTAESLICHDDFNDNTICSEWNIKGYTREILDSYSSNSQLEIDETNGQLRIHGENHLLGGYRNNHLVGWFGRSLVSNS